MSFYTYLYTDPSRNEPIYVGKGKGLRAYCHLKSKKMHPFIQRLQKMKLNGVEPIITFLCEGVDEELALLCEEMAIEKFGRKDLGKGPLLNLTDGGDGVSGVKPSEETIAKRVAKLRGQKRTPEQRALFSAAQKGLKRTEEAKMNMSVAQTCRVITDATRAKMSSAMLGKIMPSKKNDPRYTSEEARAAASTRAKASWAKRKETK